MVGIKIAVAITILCMMFLCGCPKEDTGEAIVEIGIDFEWDLEHLNRSPEVRLQNLPQGVDHIMINFFVMHCMTLTETAVEEFSPTMVPDSYLQEHSIHLAYL